MSVYFQNAAASLPDHEPMDETVSPLPIAGNDGESGNEYSLNEVDECSPIPSSENSESDTSLESDTSYLPPPTKYQKCSDTSIKTCVFGHHLRLI